MSTFDFESGTLGYPKNIKLRCSHAVPADQYCDMCHLSCRLQGIEYPISAPQLASRESEGHGP